MAEHRINTIPKSIKKLTKLSYLDLSGHKFKNIPESISNLNKLEFLILRSSEIKNIPESISNLSNLTTLDLSGNQLQSFPESVTKLPCLANLFLGDNGIEFIPESISNLSNLTTLDLSGNQLRSFPEAITKMLRLINLYLGDNEIESIPESICNLVNLININFSKNRIKHISDSLFELKLLTNLNLSANKITRLSEIIAKSPNVKQLIIKDNPIQSPPLEIVDQGIKSIKNYFVQLESGYDYIYEAKLIIVGEGGAGKTTLAKKIDNPDYQLRADEATTKGIEVINWQFPISENNFKFKVNIWDFGGQEIYHSTHQFFLTKRSLYILVADTRKEDTDFNYWMNVVELLADNSSILIVKNEKQDRHRDIDERGLRRDFINLKEILATNLNHTNRGLDVVLEHIKHHIQQLPHIGSTLPKTWIDVRGELEKLKEQGCHYISLDVYVDICNQNGFEQYTDALQLSQYLHDLGVCLHFQDDPILHKTIILQPEWGTDAVYKVLDNNTVIRNLGCFDKQDLAKIWSNRQYARMHHELLQLMRKFKLCYEIAYQKDNYIAPQLLTLNQPDYEWNHQDNLLLRYSYEFMPKGIMTRFIVEMHRDIYKNCVWRHGVVLTDNYALTEVIEYYNKKEIRIRICGKNKRDSLIIVTSEIDKINKSYEQLKCSQLIPCNCCSCKSSEEPYFYNLEELKQRAAHQKENIECSRPPFERVKVLDLIDDVMIREIYNKQEIEREKLQDISQPSVNLTINNFQQHKGDNVVSNINQSHSNGGDNIAGNKTVSNDESRNNNISGNAQVTASGAGAFSLGDISGTAANTINEPLNSDRNPEKKSLKELLSQLHTEVLQAELDPEDLEDTLEQLEIIAEALPNSENKRTKRKARGALGTIQDIASALPPSAAMVTICNQLPELINKIF